MVKERVMDVHRNHFELMTDSKRVSDCHVVVRWKGRDRTSVLGSSTPRGLDHSLNAVHKIIEVTLSE